MFLLASYGCDGVNMETDINQHDFCQPLLAHRSRCGRPLHGTPRSINGMLAFAMAGKETCSNSILEKGDIHLTAYAAKDEQGSLWLTAINKDLLCDAKVELSLPDRYAGASLPVGSPIGPQQAAGHVGRTRGFRGRCLGPRPRREGDGGRR